MTNTVVNVTQMRTKFSEILERVKFKKEIVIIKKNGKPYAVIMSTEEYKRYKDIAKEALMTTVVEIQAKNISTNEEEVIKDVAQVVEEG